MSKWLSFHLPDDFVDSYRGLRPPFGFDVLGELVFYRTYSRKKEDGSKESFVDVIKRCVEGAFSLQKDHITHHNLGWNEKKGIASAKKMFDHMFHMRFLPPGRGLWMMGTEYAHERTPMGLFNCAFISTDEMDVEPSWPFYFLMDVSMLGVGCGFDTLGANLDIPIFQPSGEEEMIIIDDSREGWVDATASLIDSYLIEGRSPINFNYDFIRKKGEPIKGFGGTASGPEPLIELHERIRKIFDKSLQEKKNPKVTSRIITDIQNMIGGCVVAGNVRRTAEIAIGSPDDKVFLDLKNYEKYPDRKDFGKYSNNTVNVETGIDYEDLAERTAKNGEPGFIWMDNVRKFGRMIDPPNYKDRNAKGTNPCAEQSLESNEVCNLVEQFLPNIKNKKQFLEVVKCAYLYGKSVTLVKTHIARTNQIQMKNRRIGLSLSGIALFREQRSLSELIEWMDEGYAAVQKYDEIYSKWLAVPQSIKTTSIKPSGTVSLVAGVTAGIHYPVGQFYIKNMRVSKDSHYVQWAKDCGYKVEDEIKYRDELDVDGKPIIVQTYDTSNWNLLQYIKDCVSKCQEYVGDSEGSLNNEIDQVHFFESEILDMILKDNEEVVVKDENDVDIHISREEVSILRSCETMTYNRQETYISNDTSVIAIPVKYDTPIRARHEVSVWEQMKLVELAQKYWADNQVSATVNFDKSKKEEIKLVLEMFDRDIKNVSFLANFEGYYPQMPEEAIDEKTYEEMVSKLSYKDIATYSLDDAVGEAGCTNDTCTL